MCWPQCRPLVLKRNLLNQRGHVQFAIRCAACFPMVELFIGMALMRCPVRGLAGLPSGIVTSPHLGPSGAPALSQPELSHGLLTQVDPIQTDGGERRLEFAHPTLFGPVLKHIPKAARPTCSAHLTSLLTKVTDSPGQVELWSDLLSFGSRVLYKPTRGGRRHNLANAIKRIKLCTCCSCRSLYS